MECMQNTEGHAEYRSACRIQNCMRGHAGYKSADGI